MSQGSQSSASKEQGASELLGLFAPPPAAPKQESSKEDESNGDSLSNDAVVGPLEATPPSFKTPPSSTVPTKIEKPGPLIQEQKVFHSNQEGKDDVFPESPPKNERTPLLMDNNSLEKLFDSPEKGVRSDEVTPKTRTRKIMHVVHHSRTASNLPPIQEALPPFPSLSTSTSNNKRRRLEACKAKLSHSLSEFCKATTWIGAFMFLLYQIVFCLTMGSAIIRPHATSSMLGLITKMAALGIMFGAPVYWYNLGADIPALYPTVDLFPAPFLANIAILIDNVLYNDESVTEAQYDAMFLGSFTFLASLAFFISGTLLVLASVFKLANLGAYLPYPVLCGFFAAVGVMTWTLAFKVDSNGKGVGAVLFSGDMSLIANSFIHHAPSVLIAAIMKWLGPKNPFYVVGLAFGTIAAFYITMVCFRWSMDDMIESGWFWSKKDLVYESIDSPIGFAVWSPPAPLGWINSLIEGKVHWGAVLEGLGTAVALSFLYLIRCSVHGACLKKNVPTLQRTETAPSNIGPLALQRQRSVRRSIRSLMHPHRRKFSEAIDIELVVPETTTAAEVSEGPATTVVSPKPANSQLKEILINFGYSQYICALVGAFGVVPAIAASPTMYMLGAEGVAPQVGSVVLLSIFYLTDFQLVAFIPKSAFSSLLVLAFIDITNSWVIKSYFKTKEKMEWLVVPAIVLLAFAVGLLSAVFLGIAMSTFLFVASFFRSGVVKYVANGITIRSTIERPLKTAKWLDQNGDLIQILVLQNYLFFGNASSILNYISSMFEDPPDDTDEIFLPPLPKIIILDLTLVTGMDTSAVDVFSDILNVCGNHGCKLFLSGVSTNLRQVMYLSGVKPESTKERAKRKLRFFSNLDAAVGKAEDILLDDENFEHHIMAKLARGEKGFEQALRQIDEQHESHFAEGLIELGEHTIQVEVEPGEIIYEDKQLERGLFFIEQGVMKIERNADFTMSRATSSGALNRLSQNQHSLNALNARTGSIGREIARLKAGGLEARNQTFRVARIGPGWVLGSIEALSGTIHPGTKVAVTHCRLHYMSYRKIEEIEEKNPLLILKLHKLLAYLMAKRQSITINQLATLHSIMSSPAQKKPLGRGSAHAKSQGSVGASRSVYV